MTRVWLGATVVAIALAGCGGNRHDNSSAAREVGIGTTIPALRIQRLHGFVERMGSLKAGHLGSGSPGSGPLYGVHLIAYVCSRSHAEASRTYSSSYRISHYVTATRALTAWGQPFRTMVEDENPLVPLGETRDVCGELEFEDVIPPWQYGGLESPLGALGYGNTDCYGVELRIEASLETADQKSATTIGSAPPGSTA